MSYDVEVMRRIVERAFTPVIVTAYGRAGSRRLRELLAALRMIYRHLPPETLTGGLVVFATLEPEDRPHNPGAAREPKSYELSGLGVSGGAVQVLPNGDLLWWDQQPDDLHTLAKQAVVYVLRAGVEAFALENELDVIENPLRLPSALAPPSFHTLEEALTYYGSNRARVSTCPTLARCWHDDRRLLLVRRPESIMRNSLTDNLRVLLRDHAEVFAEQNVSETEPVDIKVTYSQSEHRSIIEIKWLGRSVNPAGNALGTSYSANSRTDEGAQQLADYLDDHRQRSPATRVMGHMVVFDARRAGMTTYPPNPSREQAWRYRDRPFSVPARHTDRDDFAEPSRFYLEPTV